MQLQNLVKSFPKNIIGVKDSSYNLFENLKIKKFFNISWQRGKTT